MHISRDIAATLHKALGWLVLAIALVTYLSTVEPTVSYWDCPEYVTNAYGLQPGHPPGNPVWMLAARFFMNFAPATEYIPLMANALSAVCGALTVLLTFLATVLMARALIDTDRLRGTVSRGTFVACEGAGLVAALSLCWSDSFWFSAVEAEVYAFSSLTTALLFWLTLVWRGRARSPHADRYLIAIAYLLGLSIGVHELNLLCLPALLLIVAFTMRNHLKRKSIVGMMIFSIVAIGLVLYGLIPGFISHCERMELLCVNRLGLSFNSGTLAWWVITMAMFMIAIASINVRGSRRRMIVSVVVSTLAVACSGLFFFSGKVMIGIPLTLVTGAYIARKVWCGTLSMRRLRVAVWCLAMVLLGFSAYAVVIVRATARPPLNTGEPADIFAFHRYFSRDQYGKAPLLYGPVFTAEPMRMRSWRLSPDSTPVAVFNLYRTTHERQQISRAIKGMSALPRSPYATSADSAGNARMLARGGDAYIVGTYSYDLVYPPEMCMVFPRMHSHSPGDVSGYPGWSGADSTSMMRLEHVTLAADSAGRPVDWPDAPAKIRLRPTYLQNLQYFAVYQLGFMYWRYFLWNFVGRQNDYTGHGEPDCGNFITGIDSFDELMLDNVADAPAEIARGNKGRNVYYFLPLLLGILGIVAQLRRGVKGRREFLVVLTLFIVTGVAIVIYLNQGPAQARDRDYSFAGSFYAWTIWMGLGVLELTRLLGMLLRNRRPIIASRLAVLLGLCVPLQMLSQTADDHDRSGRTAARDLAYNQLVSLKPRAIIFSAEDNYLFPMVYMQHVERIRPDVRMLSLPYMVTGWYASQMHLPLRDGSRLPLTGPEGLLASPLLSNVALGNDTTWTEALPALRKLYADASRHSERGYVKLPTPRLFIPMKGDTLRIDLTQSNNGGHTSYLRLDRLLALDLLATNAAAPCPRPIYVVSGVADGIFGPQLRDHLTQVGTVSEITPGHSGIDEHTIAISTLYKWRYGNAGRTPAPYFDPTAAHNLSIQRRIVLRAALKLAAAPATAGQAAAMLRLTEREMPAAVAPYEAIPDPDNPDRYTTEGLLLARAWQRAGCALGDTAMQRKAAESQTEELQRLYSYRRWAESLRANYRPYISFRVERLLRALRAEQGCESSDKASQK